MKLYALSRARKILGISQRRIKRLTEGRRIGGYIDADTLKDVKTKVGFDRLLQRIRRLSCSPKEDA